MSVPTDGATADSATENAASSANEANDFELNDSDFADLESAEDTGKDKQDVQADDSSASDDDSDADDTSTEEDDTSSTTDDSTDGKPKAKNAAENRIRDLANSNRDKDVEISRLKTQIDQQTRDAYQPLTLEDAIKQVQSDPDFADASPAEVRREARAQVGDQASKIADYVARVQQVNADLSEESYRVMKDFPMFDPTNKSRSKEEATMADAITELYKEVGGFSYDENTQQVNQVRVMPYDFYKSHADAFNLGKKAGETAQATASAKNAAAAEPGTRATPKAPAKDKYEDALDYALKKYA